MSYKHFYRNPMIHYEEPEEEKEEVCSNGYVKRNGKPARRERDCPHDCSKGEHCEELARKAFWKGQKWKSPSR